MVFKKRKADQVEGDAAPAAKRGRGRPPKSASEPASSAPSSLTQSKPLKVQPTATSGRPKRILPENKTPQTSTRSAMNGSVSKPVSKSIKTTGNSKAKAAKPMAKPAAKEKKPAKKSKTGPVAVPAAKVKKVPKTANASRRLTKSPQKGRRDSNISIEIPDVYTTTANHVNEAEDDEDPEGPAYWLMEAEPESRIEKGKDVKFSIDDLQNATEPEAWDGVRNASARNNMRAMMKGDLAFFYHSNCKIPGIVGIMEIVEEHSVDESAFDPGHPYYDEKSTRDNPKWCCVKVEYRQKFPEIIKLKELQGFAKDGGTLANMQTLRMSRLSVSKVTKKEWDFITGLVDLDDGATSAAFQPSVV